MTFSFKKIYQSIIKRKFGSVSLIYAIKNRRNSFITIIPRPKNSSDYYRQSDKVAVPPFALVIQGRSVITDLFTEESIKIYKKSFNNTTIIVATHEGADSKECLDRLRELGVRVVVIPKPNNCGPFNINLQITSAMAGLHEAKKLGFDYAIKTRSDIRLYGVNLTEFLFNLMKTFPLKTGLNQQERIISTNIFTLKYRPYSLSDMTIAGHVDDLLDYFGAPLDERQKIELKKTMTVDDFVKERPGEIYLETEFLKKKGEKITGTVEDSWRIFAERFCVVDQQSLDSYWYKNQSYESLENKFLIYGPEFGLQDLNFREWLNLYRRFN